MHRSFYRLLTACTFACAAALRAADIPLVDPGFEKPNGAWVIADGDISSFSHDRAHSGKASLHIRDASPERGSDIRSARFPVSDLSQYRLSGWYYAVSGDGLGVYVRFFDANGQPLRDNTDGHVRGLGGTTPSWQPFTATFYPIKNAATAEIWFHSYFKAIVEGYLDDLRVESLPRLHQPPWPPQYKLSPDDTTRLTAADVVGPDGIVYPDWSRCGRQGGIPDIPDGLHIRDFGGFPNDDRDDAPALQAACNAAAGSGRAVILDSGTYHLASPVVIDRNGTVIRGQGIGKTKILFTYSLDKEPVRFPNLHDGSDLCPNTYIEIHALPRGLQRVDVTANGRNLYTWRRSKHSGNTFSCGFPSSRLDKPFTQTTPLTLTATATYADGTTRQKAITVTWRPDAPRNTASPSWAAAIHFRGRSHQDTARKLARDGKRGDTTLTLENADGYAVGDCIFIDGPATPRWKQLTQNACRWGSYRQYETRITAVNGNTITLEQPLRIEFPVIDGSRIHKITPIRDCAVENLTIEQTADLWITTVSFNTAWNCWARNIEVIKCGRFPVYGNMAKFCEFRNLVFRDAWFKGGGGTAYAGWEHCWDCLIDGIETWEYRHAPLFQWAAAGCVIRNGIFHRSDAQWHSGWTNENLIENCRVESCQDNGAYGFGMWASPPEDDAHGPNGPRNVVYNCDITCPKAGLWMGGMNECWLILHNRFTVDKGDGIFAKTCSFDHIIKDNIFILKNRSSAAIRLSTPDCFNIDFQDNTVYGTKLADGYTDGFLNLVNNRLLPLAEAASAARPSPAVPSIFEWQRQQAARRPK